MTKPEIPERDPELEPGEAPVSPETEWLAKELQGGFAPKALQSLRGIGVTFTTPEPQLAKKKTAESTEEWHANNRHSYSAENTFEAPQGDADKKLRELDDLIGNARQRMKQLQDESDDGIDDPREAQKNRRECRSIARRIDDAEEAKKHIDNICDELRDVESESSEGKDIHTLGEHWISKIFVGAKERVVGDGPDSDVSFAEPMKKMTTEFIFKLREYKKKRDKA